MDAFSCIWPGIFEITFKYLENLVLLCFHFLKFLLDQYNILAADEDGRMLFLQTELFLYIFKCNWNRETGFVDKNFYFLLI